MREAHAGHLGRGVAATGEARATAASVAAIRSRTTFEADLSSRTPWNDGWRSSPSRVHSVNVTSHTSVGFTQCAPRAGGARPSSRERRRRLLELPEPPAELRERGLGEPGPHLARVDEAPSRSCTPSSSAPS